MLLINTFKISLKEILRGKWIKWTCFCYMFHKRLLFQCLPYKTHNCLSTLKLHWNISHKIEYGCVLLRILKRSNGCNGRSEHPNTKVYDLSKVLHTFKQLREILSQYFLDRLWRGIKFATEFRGTLGKKVFFLKTLVTMKRQQITFLNLPSHYTLRRVDSNNCRVSRSSVQAQAQSTKYCSVHSSQIIFSN